MVDRRVVGAVLLSVVALLWAGCRDVPPFQCPPGRDIFCNAGPGGRCLLGTDGNGYCAYAASDCPTKLRWSERAAEVYADQCVDPMFIPMDGGVDGPPTDGGADGAPGGG